VAHARGYVVRDINGQVLVWILRDPGNRPSPMKGGCPAPLVTREAALGPHPEAPKAFRFR
jgi:hypothetical protein